LGASVLDQNHLPPTPTGNLRKKLENGKQNVTDSSLKKVFENVVLKVETACV